MRKRLTIYLALSFLTTYTVYGQETLETVASRGNVSPLSLHIKGDFVNSNTTKLFINNLHGKNWAISSGANMIDENGFHIYNWTDNNTQPLFSIGNNGNVGIGIANPSEKLHVNGIVKIGDAQDFVFSGQDAGGVFIEQVGVTVPKSGIRLQASKSGNSNDYAYVSINPYSGISFNHLGNGNSNVGIGTGPSTNEKLAVNGKIRAKEIKVEADNWPDYVFDQDYRVGTLEELEQYVKMNKHLPEMPSAADVAKNGVELGEMNKLLLKKVEELTLHLIEKDRELKVEKEKNLTQDQRITKLEQLINSKN